MRGSSAGLPVAPESRHALLTTLDLLFSALVVCPCVVSFWRSVWTLMDLYLAPQRPLLSAAISSAVGLGGHLLFIGGQRALASRFHPARSRPLFYGVSRLYTVCFAFVCVNGWRGPWDLLTVQTHRDFRSLMLTSAVGLVALVAMRALRNVASPPCVIVTDAAPGYFDVLTMFRVPAVHGRLCLFLLDCLFSVLVVGVLVVFVWRGLWMLLDLLLFPDDPVSSACASLILGYTITALVFLLQPLVRSVCSRLSGGARLLFADSFVIVALLGTVNVWRGIWMTLDIHFLPETPALSCWTAMGVSLVLLVALGCSNSLVVRGVFIDAEEPDGRCVVLPCYYFRLIFAAKKRLKISEPSGAPPSPSQQEVIVNVPPDQ